LTLPAARRVMGSAGRCLVAVAMCCPASLMTACIPIESDLGGSRPPPTIDDGGGDGSENDGGGAGPTEQTTVFDVVVEASSLAVDGIAIEATLTLVSSVTTDDDNPLIERATLRDVANDFEDASATSGIAGGIILTASNEPPADGSEFNLSVADDGFVSALLNSAAGTPGLFVLQVDDGAFDPGAIGDVYQVQAGSSFGFRIDGNVVSGTIDLNGVPVTNIGNADVYTGTFTGSLRSP